MVERACKDLNTKINNLKVVGIDLDDIEIGKRFREELGDLEALASSINKDGLIQPISVCINSDKSFGKNYRLIAGGRRYAALSHLCKQKGQSKIVSCRVFPEEMSEMRLRILEFAENLYRKDLTWQEECNLKAHIHDLQQKIHGVKTSTAPNAPGWSLTDLSEMTGKSKGSLSGDINLSKMMQETPSIDWNQFKTKNDAQKAIKQAKKTVLQSTAAKKVKESLGEGENKKKKLVDAYHVEDFFKGIKKIGNGTMDFIEIDPPYGIDLEKKKKEYNYFGYNEIDEKDYSTFMQEVFKESFRVLKNNRWMICWFGPDWFENIFQWLTNAGFKSRRIPGIWVKNSPDEDGNIYRAAGQTIQPNRFLANGYEMFFYCRKGDPSIEKQGTSNIFGFKPVPASYKIHPTERPIELIKELLNVFTFPGANILVPFAGSGNTLIAAAQNNMLPIGFDLTEDYYEGYIINVYKKC